jgi:hypothetical protein
MKREAMHLALATALVGVALGVSARGQGSGDEPLTAPAVRATQRAADRLERRYEQQNVEMRATIQAARREERRDIAQAVELRDPLPLPVEVRNPGALFVSGKPLGAVCPGTDVCLLRATANAHEVLIVTAVWSATRIQCDSFTSGSPANGAVIAPWWRCQRELIVEGPGAGYTGFAVIQ